MNYFTRGDRIPYDGIVETQEPKGYVGSSDINKRVAKLPLDLQERLRSLHIPSDIRYHVKLLVCDAYESGRGDGVRE